MHDSPVIISATDLSKRFKVYQRPTGRLIEWVTGNQLKAHTDFWALQKVSLTVRRGECLGIVGSNGSGKSTLLKILTGTMDATSGQAKIDGRVLALLELGTGFNRELSGAANIRLSSQLLGITSSYVESRFADIAAFSGLGDFLDRPIKVYSSGMLVRLAFSLFVYLEPDVLIIDEALAVGDAAFQRKCFRRMEEMISAEGRAVILVTHDTSAVTRFCTQAIWMDKGQVRMTGEPEAVVQAYLRDTLSKAPTDAPKKSVAPPLAAGGFPDQAGGPNPTRATGQIPSQGLLPRSEAAVSYPEHGAHLLGVWLEDHTGQANELLQVNHPFTLCYAVRFDRLTEHPIFGMRLATIRGEAILGSNTQTHEIDTPSFDPGQTVIIRWPVLAGLGVGDYFISCGCSKPEDPLDFYLREVDAFQFRVVGKTASMGLCSLSGKPTLAVSNEQGSA